MYIVDLLDAKSIKLHAKARNKQDALTQAVDLITSREIISNKDIFMKGVFEREKEGTTGIGGGIAIPHCKSEVVIKPALAAMVIDEGVDYDSLDEEKVKLLFLIAAPDTEDNVHLDVLSKLSMLLMDDTFTESLISARSQDEFLSICKQYENAEENKSESNRINTDYRVLAVTACPTGIAHTYMAAEALKKAGDKMGITVKVETNGSGGAKNILTDEEIAACDGIIIAADKNVDTERFDGKPVIITKVAEGIHKPDELIQRIIDGNIPIYHEAGENKSSVVSDKGSIGSKVYKHLMNGVSHMLPFVIGGGILIALAFLIDTIAGYGETGGSAFGTCTPISALFKYAGGLIMGLMVPVLAGYIAESIADRPGLSVGFLGGLLAANGNAALFAGDGSANYIWSNDTLSGIQNIANKYGFVHPDGGATVSGFLGGIAAGFLAGGIIVLLRRISDKLPQALEGIKPTLIYPVVGMFLVSAVMIFVLNPLIGVVNTGLADMLTSLAEKDMLVVLGLILGAMMAIDMGGPINKAAYVYGTMMLGTAAELIANGAAVTDSAVEACYISMAAVMAGGMVPPVGIALACIFFPKKFTKAERGSTVSNIVMGCGFITEGAIPFAAADPAHVIPCTMIGAGVAGALAAVFKCTLMAPHGGIFVFATVGNPLLYMLAWLVGSLVTCVMLGLLKNNVIEE